MSDVKDVEKKHEETTEITPKNETIRPASRLLDQIFEDFKRSVEYLMKPWYDVVLPQWFERLEPIAWHPKVDLADNGDSYTVTVEVPGLSKDQIQLNMTKDALEISGEAKEEREEKGKNYLHRERSYSSFRRCIAFPEEVIADKAEAEIKKGILTVKVPKKAPTPTEQVKVDVKESD
ncbi:MAG: Hsp20/alpha crystallin family protein [Candidatus Jordarchaeaceae archaeon]